MNMIKISFVEEVMNDIEVSNIPKEERLVKRIEGHTEDYTDGFYDGIASAHKLCIGAAKK